MTAIDATSEVFLLAFKTLPKKQRTAVFEKILEEKQFMEDILDIVTMEQRINEPSRNIDEYLRSKKNIKT